MYHHTLLVQWSLYKYKCLQDMRDKDRSSTLQKEASHTYTLSLVQNKNSILYQKYRKKKKSSGGRGGPQYKEAAEDALRASPMDQSKSFFKSKHKKSAPTNSLKAKLFPFFFEVARVVLLIQRTLQQLQTIFPT